MQLYVCSACLELFAVEGWSVVVLQLQRIAAGRKARVRVRGRPVALSARLAVVCSHCIVGPHGLLHAFPFHDCVVSSSLLGGAV